MSGGLSSGDARRFCLHVLNIYATGDIQRSIATDVLAINKNYYSWGSEYKTTIYLTGNMAVNDAKNAVGDEVTFGTNKSSTTLQRMEEHHSKIVHAICRAMLLNHKKIFSSIDVLADQISSTFMTTSEVAKLCTITTDCPADNAELFAWM